MTIIFYHKEDPKQILKLIFTFFPALQIIFLCLKQKNLSGPIHFIFSHKNENFIMCVSKQGKGIIVKMVIFFKLQKV